MSLPDLTVGEFAAFFTAAWGYPPFPWQERLAQTLAERGWPDLLDLPTGSGKTAAIDAAVFDLALQADRGPGRRAAMRIAFVVDRRLVVDDAFIRAERLADALARAVDDTGGSDVMRRVALRLRSMAGEDAPPLMARRMRGGAPREREWARTPCQPTVLCSTVDQVGSRLLFRGYGVSDAMKPVQAGLIGSDALILLDEAHLSEPFRQTARDIATVASLRGGGDKSPFHVALLTATPGVSDVETFGLSVDDRRHPVLQRRLRAPKPAALIEVKGGDAERAQALAAQARALVETLKEAGVEVPVVGVVANRIARARAAFDALQRDMGDAAQVLLIIGRARAVDREVQARGLDPIKTGREDRNRLGRPLIVVATQTIEAGVDIDLDGLVTEAASLDALRQRFGRVNRDGRDIAARGAILWSKEDRSPKKPDPVYGVALGATLDALERLVDADGQVDFGVEALGERLRTDGLVDGELKPLLAEVLNAPVLMPAHIDLWTQTSPVPACDPDVALFLHGPRREPASVQLVWRADVDAERSSELMQALLTLAPPRTEEAIELPVWAVRRWLKGERRIDLADVDGGEAPASTPAAPKGPAYRWRGPADETSGWIKPDDVRPGDTLVVPSDYGGCDDYGWRPQQTEPVRDVFDAASAPYDGKRYVFRLAPGLIRAAVSQARDAAASDDGDDGERIARAVSATLRDPDRRRGVKALIEDLTAVIPRELTPIREGLERLGRARRLDRAAFPYDREDEEAKSGVVLVAPLGLRADVDDAVDGVASTEDDEAGSFTGWPQPLKDHSLDVEDWAGRLASRSGLPLKLVQDLALAGWLHDAGKADPRFQRLLFGGDLLRMHDEGPRAKSGLGRSPPGARARTGLPPGWRHEALSVRLALENDRLGEAHDLALVLWLVGVHHGHGRPFFPHADPLDAQARTLAAVEGLVPPGIGEGVGPQSLGFVLEGERFAPTARDPHDMRGLDWATLFGELKRRYGPWGLARLEAVLRLADHRASEAARDRREASDP